MQKSAVDGSHGTDVSVGSCVGEAGMFVAVDAGRVADGALSAVGIEIESGAQAERNKTNSKRIFLIAQFPFPT